MILAELKRFLLDIESDRVERTVSISDTDKFGEAICAFSNDLPGSNKPGYLFVGATPDGRASGAVISDQLLQNLAAIRSEGHIQPLPIMNVQKHPLGGGEMAVVEVFPSDLPPVRYRGRTCIRVGPRRGTATVSEERVLTERRVDRLKTWDARRCPGSDLSDLAQALFTLNYLPNAIDWETLEENQRSIELQLASLRFYDLEARSPTYAGILAFGVDPLAFIPGAYVQYVRYAGESQADDVQEERRFGGDLLNILRDLDRLAREVAEGRPIPGADQHERMVFDYPPKAMHELLMNAVIHRNYEGSTTPILVNHYGDRIEIQNAGGLYGDLTPEQFRRGTSYRNPIIAEAAKVLGFVNRFGRGISVVESALARNESPPPEFELQPNFFLAIVRRRS
jgi:ATP-dependent DNA helicase RecG